MKNMNDNRGEDAYVWDSLVDPDEQEQMKWPYGERRIANDEPRRIRDPKPQKEPREIDPNAFPIECPPRTFPEIGREQRLTVSQVGVPMVIRYGSSDTHTEKRKRRRSAHFASYFVMTSSLVLAFVILIGALCLPIREPSALPLPDEDESTVAQKVIYVNHYGDVQGALSTPELYERCIDSVVSISVRNEKTSGIGSGFVLREDGYIATAYHVVSDMTSMEVILSDGSHHAAKLIGGDALTDLALLKIEKSGLSPVTLGTSGTLLPGERVVAIGTPASLDYAGSVSSGEVSFGLRTVKIYGETAGLLEKKMKLIQTNAPVNPGNSGCPLFDSHGCVIGMVTMKLGNQFSGMGFAIPIDGAIGILEAMRNGEALTDDLLASVSVRAARLGIVGEAYEIGGTLGVRITGFVEESPAAEVLMLGDLITMVGDRKVARPSELADALLLYEPGQTVAISVIRNGQMLQFDVVLGAIENSAKK